MRFYMFTKYQTTKINNFIYKYYMQQVNIQ